MRPKQVCVQLPTSADNVTLLAFAADVRRAAGRPAPIAVDRYLASWAHSSKPAARCCSGR